MICLDFGKRSVRLNYFPMFVLLNMFLINPYPTIIGCQLQISFKPFERFRKKNPRGCTACLIVAASQSKIHIKLQISPHFAHHLLHKYFFSLSCCIKGAVIFDRDQQDRLESKAIVPISPSCPPFEGRGSASVKGDKAFNSAKAISQKTIPMKVSGIFRLLKKYKSKRKALWKRLEIEKE